MVRNLKRESARTAHSVATIGERVKSFRLVVTGGIIFAFFLLTGCTQEPKSQDQAFVLLRNEIDPFQRGEVKNLRAKTCDVGDTHSAWFRFDYDPTIIAKLINAGLKPATKEMLDHPGAAHWSTIMLIDPPSPNAPRWWPKSPPSNGQNIYFKEVSYNNGIVNFFYGWTDNQTKTLYLAGGKWR